MTDPAYQLPRGLNRDVIRKISKHKKEPDWMLEFRLNAYKIFQSKHKPNWGVDLSRLDFNDLSYYSVAFGKKATWSEIPKEIKLVYEKLGIPEAEQKFLAGVSTQLESQVIYESLKFDLERQGVIFTDTDTAVQKYPGLFRKYFAKLVPPTDNLFAALNSAVWSGGSFVYVPKGVQIKRPLQAYFLINLARIGQFEITLIIVEEGGMAHYLEGCTAPIYRRDSLHAAVVEVFVHNRARLRYTTVQNWSKNVYNLTTKRARVEEEAVMEWVDGNIGSLATMKYPACLLVGKRAHGETLSVSFADSGQHQDTGAKMVHLAKKTTSRIIAKSVSKGTGRSSYRGLVKFGPQAAGSSAFVSCDALILNETARSDTYPIMKVSTKRITLKHEATVEKLEEKKLLYLMSRGLNRSQAEGLLVSGFISPVLKEIPLEYASELNRLINLKMEGSVG